MAVQSSITEYFNSRKRPAVDDVKRIGQPSKKVMILEKCEDVSECPEFNGSKTQLPKESPIVRRKLIYVDKQTKNLKQKNNLKPQNRSKKDSVDKVRELKNKLTGSKQLDIRKTFNILNGKLTSSTKDSPCQEDNSQLPGVTCTASENNVNSDIMENPVPEGKELLSAETENGNSVEQLTAVLDQEKTVEQLPPSVPEQEKVVKLLAAVSEQEKTVESLAVAPNKEKIVEPLDDVPEQEKAVEQLAAKPDQNKSVESTKKDSRPVKPLETVKSRKELNLGEIKAKLKRSSRCNEIKATLSRLSNGFSKLEKLRETRMNTEKPSLQKFDTVCFEVLPASPSKTPVKVSSSGMSPAKLREAVFKSPGRTLNMEPTYISPRKLFEVQPESNLLTSPNKIPAFQRFQALVSEGRSALTLPFKYRSLAEIFRSVETIVSMLHKRRETVTFTKLRKAVQEHLRRNIYEKHLGQIKTVYENAFEITYEKVPTIGKIQSDKYDLVLKPIFSNSNSNSTQSGNSEGNVTKTEMTPDVLLERKRIFYNNLLEKTKEYHEQFLLSLESPIKVDRNKITRWHPEFDVDDVPDIEPSSLPEPPNVQKTATAKDVLERARNLFGANPRLDIAMQKMSELNNKDKADPPSVSTTTTNTGPAVAALTNALKGIPKSLLEKVRAKQAARALEVMTRSPSQAKEAVRLTRLPEIARIVRNIFISEKKSVLMSETIIKKLADSYRENLSFSELNEHLDLLQQKAPELLSFCTLRKTNFVKFVKDADMSRIMARLESLASENSY